MRIFTGTTGNNNVDDPTRAKFDQKTGVVDFSESSNVYVDDTGMPRRRQGWHLLDTGVYHSLFCDGGDCFVVEDRSVYSAIMKVGVDYSLSDIRADLHKSSKVAWCQVNDSTFYSNGYQNGYIRNGTHSEWPIDVYNGPDSSEDFATAPIGTLLGHRNGYIGIGKGKDIFFNHLPFVYGLYNLKSGGVAFASDLLVIKPVRDGWFVSDSQFIWFLRGNTPADFVQEKKTVYPAYSAAIDLVEMMDLGMDNPGLAAVFATAEGICIGTPDGSIICLTNNKINMPSAAEASCLVYDKTQTVTVLR